jgi:hypothetical protein
MFVNSEFMLMLDISVAMAWLTHIYYVLMRTSKD